MYINNLLRKRGLKLYQNIFRIFVDSFLFIGPIIKYSTTTNQWSTKKTNARPSGPTPTNPRPRAKIRMQKPRVGTNFRCKSPGGCGGMVTAKIDSRIMQHKNFGLFFVTTLNWCDNEKKLNCVC